jgi:methylglutaconyl-CoA hydratase
MKNGYVKTEISSAGIGQIEFFHEKANSLPLNLLDDLAKAFKTLSLDNEVKIITLKSSGTGAFCAGASFEQLKTLKNKKEATRYFMGFGEVIYNMIRSKKLILTAVQGKAVGGGLGLIAASDYVFAAREAAVKLSEVSLGIGPFVISEPIIRRIGMGHFAALTLDTEWRDSHWCLNVGLFSRVLAEKGDLLESEINDFAFKLAPGNLKSYQHLKKIFWQDIGFNFKKLLENNF